MFTVMLAALTMSNMTVDDAAAIQALYPRWALQQNLSAAILVDVTISPDGHPHACALVTSIGDPRLAAQTCHAVMTRRLAPATGADGQPAWQVLRTTIKWFIPDAPGAGKVQLAERQPDFEVSVKQLPADADHLDAAVVITLDTTGAAVDCRTLRPATNPRLPDSICKAVGAAGASPLMIDGAAVPYLINRRVRFVAGPATTGTALQKP